MRNHVFVRPAESKDAGNVIEWSKSNPFWDPEVGRFKSTYTLCAFDKDGPLMYIPVQQPQMLDVYAARPGATDHQLATALRELIQEVITQGFIRQSGEVYFLDTDPGTSALAENQLFAPLPWKVYRVKLADLERPVQAGLPDTTK